jgi:TonB family protein
MGLWSMLSDKEYGKSVEYFNDALTAFQTNDGEMSDSEEAVRTRLVQAYESAGQSRDATQHCLALGKSQEWVVPAAPLYQRAPDIPK